MALLGSLANLVTTVSPLNGTLNVPVDAHILITFRIDMVPETINSSTIVLLDDASNRVPATVTYSERVATLVPDARLESSTRYKILVNSGATGVKSISGTVLGTDYNTNFTTAAIAPPAKAVLLAPVDRSLFSTVTEFRWNPVSNVTNYQIQISHESKFGSVLYSSVITGEAVIPDITFEHDTIYYWRVRAISNDATPVEGSWSDVWQFRFVLLVSGVPIPPPAVTPTYSQPLDIVTVIPSPEELFVTGLNKITVQFSDDVDPATINSNNFIVKVDYLDSIGEPSIFSGNYTVTGNVVEFSFDLSATPVGATPTTDVTTTALYGQNTVITVELRKEILALDGAPLADDIVWWFSTTLTPYYSKISFIRAELGELANPLTDLDIAKMILLVSQWADQIAANPYGTKNEDYLGETQAETYNNIFYQNYVRYESALRLINTNTLQRMQYQGDQKQIGDLIIKGPLNLSADYKLTLNRIEALRNKAELYLKMGPSTYPLPKSAIKGENSHPYPLNKRNSF